MKHNIDKIFWGILFLLGAVALLIGKLGYLEGVGFWTVLFTIGLIGLLVQGVFERNFGSILMSLAFLAILYDEPLGIEELTPWPVIGAAVLGTIGLNMIFSGGGHKNKKLTNHNNLQGQNYEEEYIHFMTRMGDAVKYITSKQLSRADLDCSIGNMNIYMTDALLKNGVADVKVKCFMGNTELYIPSDWRVIVNVSSFCGDVRENGHCNPNGENTLRITGRVKFGEIAIYYV